MKRLGLLLVCFATIAFASCSMTKQAASNAVAYSAGQVCGNAVKGLYDSYKASGNLNLTNTSNLNNTLAIATAYTTLKENKNDATYKKSFAGGMVAAAGGLFTTSTALQFIDNMLTAKGLDGLTSSNIGQTAQTAATVISLLNTLKQ